VPGLVSCAVTGLLEQRFGHLLMESWLWTRAGNWRCLVGYGSWNPRWMVSGLWEYEKCTKAGAMLGID
jgi:hypothetical protein